MTIDNKNNNKVFFVTGTSNGMGLSLVQKLIVDGYKVAALTRRPDELKKQVTEGDYLNNLLIIKSDITNEDSIKEAVELTLSKFNRIDVVVNNAGYGLLGSVEELSLDEFTNSFQVNLFSVFLVIKHVSKHFRKQGTGLFINIGSYLGHTSLISSYSAYAASKHALTGLSTSADLELKPFGVRSLLISAGGFRTSFLKSGVQIAKNTIPDYNTQSYVDYFDAAAKGDEIKGDPNKLAKVLIELGNTPDYSTLPNNIHIGSDSFAIISKSLNDELQNLQQYKEITFSTDF
eukprot:gene8508-10459_t